MRGPTQNLGPIGSAVLTFFEHKQANKHTDTQTPKQSIYRLFYLSLKSVQTKTVV